MDPGVPDFDRNLNWVDARPLAPITSRRRLQLR